MSAKFPILTAEEAAAMIQNGQTIGFSGFTPAGACKVVPKAIAARAEALHAEGKPFKINVITGASTGDSLDGVLARADAIGWRTPYQSNKSLRDSINAGNAQYFDMHLSMTPQFMRYGFLGPIHWAIVEACDVSDNGEIVLTTSVGTAPTSLALADKVIIELNAYHSKQLRGIHDIYEPLNPPNRREIPIYAAGDRCGSPVVKIDPSKIAGIVLTDAHDEVKAFRETDPISDHIGEEVAEFLAREFHAGRIPSCFLPLQSGVGNIANAVLGSLGRNKDIPAFDMYSEVIQDSVVGLIEAGKVKVGSATSLTLSPEALQKVYDNIEEFKKHLVLRPQEISNSPEVARRIGVISINTPIEVDIFGNVNSSQILGTKLMNGIGGSGDFTRNAYISIFSGPSTTKGGKISTVVPMVSHVDHSEHSVQVIITEQGVADLRGKSPRQRAELIINHCAHPDYREGLLRYLREMNQSGQTPHPLEKAFAMHEKFLAEGDMHGAL